MSNAKCNGVKNIDGRSLLNYSFHIKTEPDAQRGGMWLADQNAVYLTPDRFPVTADGLADDAAALQEAIDRAGTNNQAGVLFVPSGTYRLGTTVYVWPNSITTLSCP